jgi:hypothetical protein
MIVDDTNPNLASLPPVPEPEPQNTPSDVAPQSTEAQGEVSQQPEVPKESSEERNFRNLREKAERIQRERDEALVRLRQYEEAQKSESDELNLGPNDLAEGKHLSKVESKIKVLEHQLQEAKLRSQYPDIDKVVNSESLSRLKEKYPELATTIGASKDFYSQAVSAYTMIKQLGISDESMGYETDKAIIQRNAAKPRPLASVAPQQGDSPLSKANAFANGLTEDLRKQLHKEMIDAIKSR